MSVGVTLDYADVSSKRAKLQAAADAVAVATAKQLSVAGGDKKQIEAYVETFLGSAIDGAFKSKPDVDLTKRRVKIEIVQPVDSAFGSTFGLASLVPQLKVMAIAQVVGTGNVCVLALNDNDGGIINLEKSSTIEARQCSVFLNSKHTDSIKSKEKSLLSADMICSAGGTEGRDKNFKPMPTLDCPQFDDPLKSRDLKYDTVCTHSNKVEVSKDDMITSGVFCDGMVISGDARVVMDAGVYVFKGSVLEVKDEAQLIGSDVTLIFEGDGSTFLFDRDTTIDLSARETGHTAGILIAANPSNDYETFKILSDNAHTMVGTVYIPNGELFIETEEKVAQNSAFTAIVADRVKLIGDAHLVLNSDYHLTDVPVPAEIVGTGGRIVVER